MALTHHSASLVQTTATGGAAGDITVTGIKIQDVLVSVVNLADGVDLTGEFTITGANTINNTGGTSTAADRLLVLYWSAHVKGGGFNRS